MICHQRKASFVFKAIAAFGVIALLFSTSEASAAFGRIMRLPKHATKSWTITSYVYTNSTSMSSYDWIKEDHGGVPLPIPAGTGFVEMPCKPGFNPDDLHITYSWDNSPFEHTVWIFIANKGGTFTWRPRCFKDILQNTYECQQGIASTCCSGPTPPSMPCSSANCSNLVCNTSDIEGEIENGLDCDIDEGGCAPAVSVWGIVAMAVLSLGVATVILRRNRLANCA